MYMEDCFSSAVCAAKTRGFVRTPLNHTIGKGWLVCQLLTLLDGFETEIMFKLHVKFFSQHHTAVGGAPQFPGAQLTTAN